MDTDLVRSLIEHITLTPDGNRQRAEVRGELAAILALAGGAANVKGAESNGALVEQIKMVAGAGNHRRFTQMMVAC